MIPGGEMKLPKMNGKEISPGIWIIGEPTPVIGTDKLRCLADVYGMLALVELKITFSENGICLDQNP